MRCKTVTLSALRFGERMSLFTENPLSTAAWPWDKVRKSCILHQRPSYVFCRFSTSKKNVSNWSSPNFNPANLSLWDFFTSETSFLYYIYISSAYSGVLHVLSTSFVSTYLNIATALSGSAVTSLGSSLISFLAKLYLSGLLSCILVTIAANIAQHSFFNSKTCPDLSFFSL